MLIKSTESLAHAMNHLAPGILTSFVLKYFFYFKHTYYATHI